MASAIPDLEKRASRNDFSSTFSLICEKLFCALRDTAEALRRSPYKEEAHERTYSRTYVTYSRTYDIGGGQVTLALTDATNVFDPGYAVFMSHPNRQGLRDLMRLMGYKRGLP